MTRAEEARDKLKYWNLISRAERINFKIPPNWLKYGYPPIKSGIIVEVCLDSISDKLLSLFDRDDIFFNSIKKE